MKTIVDGIATEYLDEGSGPILLMLHGWGNTLHYFDELVSELKTFRIIRLDLSGFGETETPPEVWTVESYAHFVAHFCERLGINPDVIIGHSLGGRIITKGVAHNILTPQKIVLIASAGTEDRKTLRNMFFSTIAKIGKIILLPFPRCCYESARRFLYRQTGSDYLTAADMSGTFLNVIREDLSDDAATIVIPALLVWGQNDAITLVSAGEKLHRLMPQSELFVMPDAGHFVHREYPAEVGRAIRAFL